MMILNFLYLKKIIARLKRIISALIFGFENGLVYPVHVSDEKFEDCMDLLLITDNNKSYYVYLKDFNRFLCNKIKPGNYNTKRNNM